MTMEALVTVLPRAMGPRRSYRAGHQFRKLGTWDLLWRWR